MYKVMGDNKYTGFSELFKTTMYNLGTKKKEKQGGIQKLEMQGNCKLI